MIGLSVTASIWLMTTMRSRYLIVGATLPPPERARLHGQHDARPELIDDPASAFADGAVALAENNSTSVEFNAR